MIRPVRSDGVVRSLMHLFHLALGTGCGKLGPGPGEYQPVSGSEGILRGALGYALLTEHSDWTLSYHCGTLKLPEPETLIRVCLRVVIKSPVEKLKPQASRVLIKIDSSQ